MVKKIKFPLEMDNGVMVRTLEELKDNFSLEKILGHFTSGKLVTWLNDRYYEDEAVQVGELNSSSVDLKKRLCEIFDVEYNDDTEIDLETLEQRNMKISKLKQFTEDDEIIKNIDKVAFDQEELAELLDEDITPIYLCGEKFTIPLSKGNVTYYGVNNPIVVVKSKVLVDFSTKNIVLKDVRYNEKYQKVINDSIKNEKMEDKFISGSYKTLSLLDFMMKSSDKKASSKLFSIICREISSLNYDIDKNIKSKVEIIKQANLCEAFNSYLNKSS